MISNRTVIPTNQTMDWQFVKLSYPVSSKLVRNGSKFVISILRPDGDKTSTVAGYFYENNWYEVDEDLEKFAIASLYEKKTLFFFIFYDRHSVKPGTYTVSLKVKDYFPPCEIINITIKGSFCVRF